MAQIKENKLERKQETGNKLVTNWMKKTDK
jgi:hypothetical protein